MRTSHLLVDALHRSFAHAGRHIAEDRSAENADLRVREELLVPKFRPIDRKNISRRPDKFEEIAVGIVTEFERYTYRKSIEVSNAEAAESDTKPAITNRFNNWREERRNKGPSGISEIAPRYSCRRVGGPFL